MTTAIIPARIGSKRIKKKNIKKFLGNPILHQTLQRLIKSNIFKTIIISSDSPKILRDCEKKFNIKTHHRKKKYSKDSTTTISAIKSCIREMNISSAENICCIYPCAVMLNIDDLRKTKSILKNNEDYFVIPIKKFPHPIERALSLSTSNKIKIIDDKYSNIKTQKTQTFYHDVGQFYWGKASNWNKANSILKKSIGFLTNRIEYIDIDTIDDWKLAEKVFKMLK